MNAKNGSTTVKTLANGLIVGGIALATLATTGCDRRTAEEVTAWTSGSAEATTDQLGIAEKPDLRIRLSANHNETFLASTTV